MTPLQPRILTDDVQKDQTKLEQPCRNIFWVMRGSKYMLIMMIEIYILSNDVHKIYWVIMFKGKNKVGPMMDKERKVKFSCTGHYTWMLPTPLQLCHSVMQKEATRTLRSFQGEKGWRGKKRWKGSFLFAATIVAKISGPVWCNRGGEC